MHLFVFSKTVDSFNPVKNVKLQKEVFQEEHTNVKILS